jgi:hypothetical protein
MTYQQGVKLACRAFSLYLLFWVLSDLIDVPREAMVVLHYVRVESHSPNPMDLYFLREYSMVLEANVLKASLWGLFAWLFYRGGPWISRFFDVPNQTPKSDE